MSRLSKAGAEFVETEFPELAEMVAVNARGGIGPAEAYRFHEKLGTNIEKYDAVVRERVFRGSTISDADYNHMIDIRRRVIRDFD